jgi:hypothetical protein
LAVADRINTYINVYRKNQWQPAQFPTADITDLPSTAFDRNSTP